MNVDWARLVIINIETMVKHSAQLYMKTRAAIASGDEGFNIDKP